MYASVIVNVSAKAVSRLFEYEVPKSLEKIVKPGIRVVVDFNSRLTTAMVVFLSANSSYETEQLNKDTKTVKIKEIQSVIDVKPILTKELLTLVDYLKNKSFTTYQQCFDLVIPSALHTNHKREIVIINENLLDEISIKRIKTQKYLNDIKEKSDIEWLNKRILEGSVGLIDKFSKKHKAKTEIVYSLLKTSNQLTLKQQQAIDLLSSPKTRKELKEEGISLDVLNRMSNKGLIQAKTVETLRRVRHQFTENSNLVELTNEQANAYHQIKASYGNYRRFLIQGITGSGKTEVYLSLIKDMLDHQKQVLILVPEIALIPQMAERIRARFDEEIAIVHSKLSSNERYDQWRLIDQNKASIVVGTRSACFMPFNRLGLIVIDEEQDRSYIQKDVPSYDANELCMFRAKHHKIPLIYGSATPSIKTTYDVSLGKITKLCLTKRPVGVEPSIRVIDMKEELISGNLSVFSSKLKQAVEKRLKKKEQSMILVNKRGYASFVMCRECSHVIKCEHCQISLSYHKKEHRLKCHHCGFERPMPSKCGVCQSTKIREVGIGIEQVEERLIKEFPTARILRMDKDTTKGKHAIDEKLSAFNHQTYDILIGTSMISKGHDFKNVTLVAVMLADLQLKLPSYLANEETYNMIAQAAGRPGRKGQSSEVIIQAYEVNHFVIQSILNKDYMSYYKQEIRQRQLGRYQPIYQVVKVILKGEEDDKTSQSLLALKRQLLKRHSQFEILGPTPLYIHYQNKRFLHQITIKTRPNYDLNPILDRIENYYKDKSFYLEFDFYPDMIE